MKTFTLLLLTLFLTSSTQAQEEQRYFNGCHAPGHPFFEGKIRESYKFPVAEEKIKKIVYDRKNAYLREEVRSLKSDFTEASGEDKEKLGQRLYSKFEQMIFNTRNLEPQTNFPYEEANSLIESSHKGSVIIMMENLQQEELGFMESEVLKKLSRNARIHYAFPEDKYEYFVTYDGKELPLNKAISRIQLDFEEACALRVMKNENIRDQNCAVFNNCRGMQGGSGGSRR